MSSALRPVTSLSRHPRAVLTLACALSSALAAGCAASGAMRRGQAAERHQDYDAAVVEFSKVVRQHPNDEDARASLERAKLKASQDHFSKGRRLAATGKLDLAVAEYE